MVFKILRKISWRSTFSPDLATLKLEQLLLVFPATTTKPSALVVVEAAGTEPEPDIRVNDVLGRKDIRISVRSGLFGLLSVRSRSCGLGL